MRWTQLYDNTLILTNEIDYSQAPAIAQLYLPHVCIHRYSSDTKDSTFSVGLQGLKEDDVDKVKDLIWSTLEKVAE